MYLFIYIYICILIYSMIYTSWMIFQGSFSVLWVKLTFQKWPASNLRVNKSSVETGDGSWGSWWIIIPSLVTRRLRRASTRSIVDRRKRPPNLRENLVSSTTTSTSRFSGKPTRATPDDKSYSFRRFVQQKITHSFDVYCLFCIPL